MKKWIYKVSKAVQVVLVAPVTLPTKVRAILKYVGLGLGLIETVLEQPVDKGKQDEDRQLENRQLSEGDADGMPEPLSVKQREEVPRET